MIIKHHTRNKNTIFLKKVFGFKLCFKLSALDIVICARFGIFWGKKHINMVIDHLFVFISVFNASFPITAEIAESLRDRLYTIVAVINILNFLQT